MKKHTKLILLSSLFFTPTTLSAALIHAVGVNVVSTGNLATNYSEITSWFDILANGDGMASETINGSVDGINFTYTVTLSAFQHTPATAPVSFGFGVHSSGQLGLRPAAGFFAVDRGVGQGFTVSIQNISNSDIEFDGFTQFASGFVDRGEGAKINGNDYKRANKSIDPAWILTAAPEPDFSYASIGITRARYVEFQFSSVPEPSSSMLLSLGGLGLILHRRK